MLLSRNWLASYVDLPESLEELDQILTNVGLEVESIEDRREAFANIVVGDVRTCEKHPDADKLSVCTVDDGTGSHTVVCGAPNVRAGQKIVFARVGARIETLGFTIDRRKIRGVESAGMICSTAELGLDDDHSGIAVLDDNAVPGTPIARHLGLDDVILGIGITPNRGDALSHIGTARDIAAARGTELRLPEVPALTVALPEPFMIENRSPSLCPRYTGAILRNIRVMESPDWLRQALTAAGIRPINNIVDVTNYVMMEIGQPMHAFDLATLQGSRIVVRTADAGERMTTLDGQERELPADALLICDERQPVAIAGVMGGAQSSVTDGTTSILLESACFDPSSVRRTARLLQLSTDSSYRFERGSDPNITAWAIHRAAQLILSIGHGEVTGVYDNYPVPIARRRIALRPAFVNRLLGIEIDAGRQREILRALQIEIVEEDADAFTCLVPTFRGDLEREIDLVEEIARIHGYDAIPVPTRIEMNVGHRFDDQEFPRTLRRLVLGFGFDEILSSSLVPRDHAGIGRAASDVSVVRNPVSKERPALRTSLLPSLLEAIDLNCRNGHDSLRIAEIGHVFSREATAASDAHGGARVEERTSFIERNMLALAITGNASDREWYSAVRPADFFDLKGAVEAMLAALYIDNETIFSYDRSSTLSENVLTLEVKGRYAGQLVEISDTILASFDIDQPVYYAELDIDTLRDAVSDRQTYVPVPKFPSVTRDLAIVVDASIPAARIVETVRNTRAANLRNVRVVDVFSNESLGRNRKSVAFTMTFQSEERTLRDDEINGAVDAIVTSLRRDFTAELRA
ncbi:MAG: phenylalanine--tRNA ligase subunit beta [Bacteroidota bacterium]|jgi:phenylalanyl-tRNA synthetase beta chain|nr:phenylalanine--tRNA ligase subunit beta [Bacteroidota bacterium]